MFPSFGIDKATELEPVKALMRSLRESPKTTLNSIETQLLLRELYDEVFEVFSHKDRGRPMSLVAMHPKEQHQPYSRQERLMTRFAKEKVGELFNISITDFLNLPRDQVEMMLRIAEDIARKQDQDNHDAIKAIDKQMPR